MSRVVILVAMFLAAPHVVARPGAVLPVPGWELFTRWDGHWYEQIATKGYEFLPDGNYHSVAFFPLYPLLIATVMHAGIGFAIAATLISNVAFLVALCAVLQWARALTNAAIARWTVAVLCFSPLSLFATVAYSESLFLALTALAFRDFAQRRFWWAALWVALSSATRLTGALFFPAFLLAAVLRKFPWPAYVAACAGLVGSAAFYLYCASAFHDGLAFAHAQVPWRGNLGFDYSWWNGMFSVGIRGQIPFQLATVSIAAWCWVRRRHLPKLVIWAVSVLLIIAELSLWQSYDKKFTTIFCAGVLLLLYARTIGVPAFVYGISGLAIIFFSGLPLSAERIAYGLLPLSFALGIAFARAPVFGSAVLIVGAGELAFDALAFSQMLFVA